MATDQEQQEKPSIETNGLEVIMPVFFNPDDPDSFWNEDEVKAFAALSTRTFPSYPYVDAAEMIINKKILEWTAGRTQDEIIDFYCSDLFLQLIESIPAADFKRFSKYVQDVDKGWIIRHLCIYLAEIYMQTPNNDERKMLLYTRFKRISRLVMSLWSKQYRNAFSINLAYFEILDESSGLDIAKVTQLIEAEFNEKSRYMVKALMQSALKKQKLNEG